MKVLLALDGSAPSMIARDLVSSLPWPEGTTLHVLTAYQVPVDWTGGVGSTMSWVGDIEDATRDQLTEDMEAWTAPLRDRSFAVERHIVAGRAADVIVDTATELGVDLIVTGSRGRGPLRSMLLGSVATEVANHAASPVLVARLPQVTRLLIGTDGSANANAIPERLSRWGIFEGIAADSVAVSIPDTPAFELVVGLYTLGNEKLADQRRELRQRYQADAEAMAEALRAIGIETTPHVRAGDPAGQILEAAEDHGSDLIVTGSRGLGTLGRLLLGSVARNVLVNARCSVLVMRTGTESQPEPKEAA